MIYWFTGQPGHGKTLHAVEKLLEFKAKGRVVYACNVRQFDYEKTGVLPMTPEQFRDWMNFLPDGAVALVDEAYEHGMLPKRPPGAPVPPHVQELAKHRHRGLDFIFVSQSPDKQCDVFVQDLIERHVHVRRMFGSNVVQLRNFDRYEANAEKATPISSTRGPLLGNKKAVGTYKSTEMDTTERRIPWYYFAFGIGIPLCVGILWYVFGGIADRLGGAKVSEQVSAQPVAITGSPTREANGALATVAEARPSLTVDQYAEQFTPRIPSQPWSAPVYDSLSVSNEPPRLFCMLSGPGELVDGEWRDNSSCTCVTEQGSRYWLEMQACVTVARYGQYEPYFSERSEQRRVDGPAQQEMIYADQRARRVGDQVSGGAGTAPRPMVDSSFGTITRPAL